MDVVWKRVLITWWTAGIWYATACLFAEKWASVIVSYAHNDERAKKVEKELCTLSGRDCYVVKATSSTKEWRKQLQEACEKIGKFDILVNNIWKAFPDIHNTSVWEAMFNHHFMSTVEMTEWFVDQLWERRWCIVNIWSVAWTEPLSWYKVARNESYCCIKAMIETYTRVMANTYRWKVRVNTVSPWNTKTIWREGASQEIVDARMKWTLIQRFVQPEEIWSTVFHVVENEAINWHTFVVDWWVVAKWYE